MQVAADLGSSPLTRGKPADLFQTYVLPGLIPAHAGKTVVDAISSNDFGAHPRSRGENSAQHVQ